MKEFFYSADLYDAIDKVVNNKVGLIEDSIYFDDALDVLRKEYCKPEARNILLGPLNKDLQEFDDIGFLTKRPFSGNIVCNPDIKNLQIEYGLDRDELERNYKANLMLGKNSLGAQIINFDVSSYFLVEGKSGPLIARCIKWGKHDISLSMFFSPSEYNDIIKTPKYVRSVCQLNHMKVFKVLMHKVETDKMPYSDEFYDSL